MGNMNQCDGCRRGLPVRDGLHAGPDGVYDLIGCTAHLYLTHGDQRNYKRIVEDGSTVEYVDPEGKAVYKGPGSYFETFTSDRWCSTCRKWVTCQGILGEIRFKAEHGEPGFHQ